MKAAEHKCHKFMQRHIEYSPKTDIWIKRRWTSSGVIRFIEGQIPDPRNLFKRCKKQQITDPRKLVLEEAWIEMFICQQKLEELRPQAPKLRKQHLDDCLKEATEEEDTERIQAIKRVLEREAARKRWARVN